MTTALQSKKPCLLVMAGGTGGHIFPGLAVADELKAQGWRIHWLGTAAKMEADIIPKHGYDISFIDIAGVRNNGLVAKIVMPFKLLKSLLQAIRVIKAIKPDVVLGMGGYASAPGGIAAWFLNIPLVLHEQNAAAGLTNRLLSRFANKICCAFPNAFASNIDAEVVGNPLRKSIGLSKLQSDLHSNACSIEQADIKKSGKNVLIVGGSLGAQILNQIMPQTYKQLAASPYSVNIHHQTGKGKKDEVLSSYPQEDLTSEKVQVDEFINDIAAAYQWADLVICRAGALTVSELAMAGKAAIFVPLPHAVDDHQTKNAQYLVNCGSAKLLPQDQLTPEGLAELLTELFSDEKTLVNMRNAAFDAADKQATQKVAAFCQKFLKR